MSAEKVADGAGRAVRLPAGALEIEPRIIRRVIKRDRRLSGLGAQVPHAHCYVIGREALRQIASDAELGQPAGALPESVVLVARAEEGGAEERIVSSWRRAFHARVHQELDRRARAGRLSDATVRGRIHRIGQTEFDEARRVLRQDDLMFPGSTDRQAYVEFAAYFLELRHFAPADLERTFPTLSDKAGVEATLALDVDAAALLSSTRPDGAPASPPQQSEAEEARRKELEQAPVALEAPPSSPDADRLAKAEKERQRGNRVRAAVLSISAGKEELARADLAELSARLERALGGGEASERGRRSPGHGRGEGEASWPSMMLELARVAALARGGGLGPEARLLLDLQMACVDRERGRKTVDVVGAALSLGARKIVRDLPAEREVRVVRHVRAARAKAPRARLSPASRAALLAMLAEAEERAETGAREALSPTIKAVLEEVGLRPSNAPERVALRKLVEELLDKVLERGFLGFGQLRDALSSSHLKLPNVAGVGAFFGGDALLRADLRLSIELDGVYRRGEIYMRWLEKLSSLFFGTRPGRLLTLHVLLPCLVSFVALEGLSHLVGPLIGKLMGGHGAHAQAAEQGGHAAHAAHVSLLTPWSFALLSLFLWGCLHSEAFRGGVLSVLRAIGRGVKAVVFDAPRFVLSLPAVRAVVESLPAKLLGRYVIKPGALGAVGFEAARRASALFAARGLPTPPEAPWAVAAAIYLAFAVVLNTGAGARLEEVAVDWVEQRWHQLQRHVLPGLLQLVGQLFGGLLEGLDRALYTVDEWLRFKEGQSKAALWAKGALGVVWFFVTYVVRLYANVLIEPQVNPIKHFPVVTVSHKIILPMSGTVYAALRGPLSPLGPVIANAIAGSTVFLLPGMFGFIVWELKGNWGLYSQNRPRELDPVRVGHHGETLDGLLRPGFHSGTVPKLYAKLRRAAHKGQHSADKHREELRHIEEAIARFVERELLALLGECGRWTAGPVHVGEVHVASNRIRVRLACPAASPEPAWLHFEEQSGLLVASVARPGFLDALDQGSRGVFEAALAGLYKMANVDVCREQIEARLERGTAYDISDEGLVVWPDRAYQSEVLYPLGKGETLEARPRGTPLPSPPPPLPSRDILFVRQRIEWSTWVAHWGEAKKTDLEGLRALSLLPAAPAPRSPSPEAAAARAEVETVGLTRETRLSAGLSFTASVG